MKLTTLCGSLAVALMLALPAMAQTPAAPPAGDQPQPPRMMERHMGMPDRGMAGEMGPARWGDQQWRGHHSRRGPGGRPLISMMLRHRQELGLSAQQVESLEKLRADFMRDAIRRQADQKVARLDLFTLMRPDPNDPTKPIDMGKVEGKIREIEKMRADLMVARLQTIETGKAQLTDEQRTKLASLMAQMRSMHRRGPEPPAPPRS